MSIVFVVEDEAFSLNPNIPNDGLSKEVPSFPLRGLKLKSLRSP